VLTRQLTRFSKLYTQTYTAWPKKLFVRLNFIRFDFIKYWPIFKLISLSESEEYF